MTNDKMRNLESINPADVLSCIICSQDEIIRNQESVIRKLKREAEEKDKEIHRKDEMLEFLAKEVPVMDILFSKACSDSAEEQSFHINRILKSGPATIFYWSDGTLTKVRKAEGDPESDLTAFVYALAKKKYGNMSRLRKEIDHAVYAFQESRCDKKDPVCEDSSSGDEDPEAGQTGEVVAAHKSPDSIVIEDAVEQESELSFF